MARRSSIIAFSNLSKLRAKIKFKMPFGYILHLLLVDGKLINILEMLKRDDVLKIYEVVTVRVQLGL